ncbi:hypothetical protein C8Q80DRAFT_1222176 [Daedaleopsis nitida]|nr:hypothetical protein C8Q80DRAFT_1222176 [Daedaleopsis nitida]
MDLRRVAGNPAFAEHLRYEPQKLFVDGQGQERLYDEMWTGDWWWDLQSSLPPGATIAPVILSSDKTQLSRFSGDKQAWPVYLSLGNIPKGIRRQPSQHAMVLVGYIPVSKLERFTKGKRRSLEGYRLFHECMRAILKPLVHAMNNGVDLVCADGRIRRVHPIVAAYIADHPEQCLVAGCQENFCPKCTVHSSKLGDPLHSMLKDPESVWQIIEGEVQGDKPAEFRNLGLRLIDPFWRGADELDRRFKAMPSHPALQHFKRGISLVSQWTGTEYKHMERVFVGAITGACPPSVLHAVRAVLDFIFYAHFEAHTDRSIALMDTAWDTFHRNKHVFKDLCVREHFNIPKVHSAVHYALSIRKLGTTDGYNTEQSERLHIDYAKRSYAASNKKAYIKQMAVWLNRQEAVSRFQAYLDWAEPSTAVTNELLDSAQLCEADIDVVMQEAGPGGPDLSESNTFDSESLPPYMVSKTPGLPGISVRQLVSDFGCTDFVYAFEDFLRKTSHSRRTLPLAARTISLRTRFAVYRRCHVFLPPLRQVSRTPIKDTIRAVPAQPARPLQPASHARFDTVLAHPLSGLTVARVRAIFRLPDFKHPLAYVEWFTPFRRPEPDTGMFKVSHSHYRGGRRRASIIPLTQIVRSCHLLPIWGKHVDPAWTSKNVLDKCTRFFVNPYLRHHDFMYSYYSTRYVYTL